MVAGVFNQFDYLEGCVDMIVIDEMPFNIVDKMGFDRFSSVAIVLLCVLSRTLVRTFLRMYD